MGQEDNVRRALDLGANDYIVKSDININKLQKELCANCNDFKKRPSYFTDFFFFPAKCRGNFYQGWRFDFENFGVKTGAAYIGRQRPKTLL